MFAHLTDWLALALVVGFGIPLAVIDLREHRLPNRLTLAMFVALAGLLVADAGITSDWQRLGAAALGSLAMTALYLLLALVPNGMGMGDVKLAASIGLLCAWWSWSAWAFALFAAFAVGGVMAIIQLVRRRDRRAHLAFGPAMLVGCVLAAVAAIT